MRTLHLLLVFLGISLMVSAQSDDFKTYKTVFSQGFGKDKSMEAFDFSNASKWLISKSGKTGKSLKCLGKGDYQNPLQGPSIVAILKGYELKDFVLEMDIVQDGKDFSLLDFCIFFGVKDTANYCYAQIASNAGKKMHNVFMVKGDKPKRIGAVNEKGVIWRMKEWQHVRMERTSADKMIKVYLDQQLVLECADEMFDAGLIGFGSTKSAIKIDNFEVSAPAYEVNDVTLF